MPPQSAAGNESAWQVHTPTPQSTYPNEPNLLGIYATGISVGAVVAVFVSVIEFRKKRK
jgi:hydroxyethylthiazole kinase-like sugar kinase family protein